METIQKPARIWSDRKRHLGMPISFTRYSLSEDRLFNETGLLTTTENETLLYRISDLTVRISLWQRIFGVGTVLVRSTDPTQPELELKNVRHPRDVKELLHRHVEMNREKYGVRASELVGGGALPGHGHHDVDLDGDGIPDIEACDPPMQR